MPSEEFPLECSPDCEWCPCPNCGCPMREHSEPDLNMLAENGIDWEDAYCNGRLNYCGMCGDCTISPDKIEENFPGSNICSLNMRHEMENAHWESESEAELIQRVNHIAELWVAHGSPDF